jgi:uncharacterized membrane protein YozB (DUF420 family)
MEYYQIVATVSLGVQIAVLFLLIGGFSLKRMKKFRQHGITMLSAVVLHAILVLTWMLPSFRSFFTAPGSINFADTIVIVVLVHAFAGIAALVLGVWLVGSWRLKADLKTCFAKKKIMRVTLPLWLIALFLGIILYLKVLQLF